VVTVNAQAHATSVGR